MRKLFTLFFSFALLTTATQAQKVSGLIKDQEGKGLDKSTVSLLRAKDSSVIKLAVTTDNGRFSFSAEPGKYLVSASHVGYQPALSGVFELSGAGEMTVPELSLAKAAGNLRECDRDFTKTDDRSKGRQNDPECGRNDQCCW